MTKPTYVNWFIYSFYLSLKVLVFTVCRVFFSKKTIIHPERFKIDRPTILVSNHPNTLLDPLTVAVHADAVVFFLANASLFKASFANWFLNNTYAIPIERPQDVGGKMVKNEQNFARCDDFLSAGGCLYIAPEGGSKMPRRLNRIKTGTARIALSAENKNNFDLNLQILPVGLSYTASTDFREEILLNVGAPIVVREFQEAYQKDAHKAAKKLTAFLTEKMKELIVDTRDDEEDLLLHRLEEILANETPLPPAQTFERGKVLSGLVQELPTADYDLLLDRGKNYFEGMEGKMTDAAAKELTEGPRSRWLTLIAGAPLFLWGWVNNFLAAWVPKWVVGKLKLYIGYTSAVKTLAGILTFPLFYALQTWLVNWIFETPWLTWAYLASLVPMGLFAWWYRGYAQQHQELQQARRFRQNNPKAFDDMWQKRQELSQQVMNILTSSPVASNT